MLVALARPQASSAASAIARLSAAGAVGPALWSVLLVALGAFATSPVAAIVSLIALVLAVAIAARSTGPKIAKATTASPRNETMPAFALAGALLLLTVWPTPLFVAQGDGGRVGWWRSSTHLVRIKSRSSMRPNAKFF